MSEISKYAQLGIDAGKQSVKDTFSRYIENEYPLAFVNIIRDPLNPGYGITQHSDGDGSKFVERMLIYAETHDPKIIRGAADDALQMNLGDIAASGFVFGPILITDVININSFAVPKKIIMEEIGHRFGELLELYKNHGFDIHFLGGETADLPTQVSNVVFDVTVSARAKESDIIAGDTKPGDKIYGFASDGQAIWEDTYNSGIMSNGLTLARTGTMWKGYAEKYPHLGAYEGNYKVGETANLSHQIAVSEALVSPTRQWALLIKNLLERLKEEDIYDSLHGISMNTGGGVGKVNNIGQGILYRKRMPTPPEIFQLIQKETREQWSNMFQIFNCGVGIDVIGNDNPRFKKILEEVSEGTNIKLYELGECATSADGTNRVIAETEYGVFEY